MPTLAEQGAGHLSWVTTTVGMTMHSLVGGMMGGGILYALTFPWVAKHILPIADLGTMTLDKLLGIPVWAVFVILAVVAGVVFAFVRKLEKSSRG